VATGEGQSGGRVRLWDPVTARAVTAANPLPAAHPGPVRYLAFDKTNR
jgi:hypothetical protein